MSSGFSTLSMKDGMGVPLTPVARRMAMSSGAGPPRKVHRLVRFAGLIGRPQSSFSSDRDGPSARPSVPWHLLHDRLEHLSAALDRLRRGADHRGERLGRRRLLEPVGREGLNVGDDIPAVRLGELPPGRHVGAGHAVGDDGEQILVRGGLGGGRPDLEDARREVAGPGIEELGGGPVAVALHPVTRGAAAIVEIPAPVRVAGRRPPGRRRHDRREQREQGRQKPRGPPAAGRRPGAPRHFASQRRGCWPVAS